MAYSRLLSQWYKKTAHGIRSIFRKGKIHDVPVKKILIRSFLYLAVSGISAVLLLILLVYAGAFGKLPAMDELQSIRHPLASEVFSSDSVLMGRYYIQNRVDLKDGELTPAIREALLSTEDARFYQHGGIDVRSLFRVFFKTILLNHSSSGGGSTITQQLAKNLFPRKDYGILSLPVNKLQEMFIALRIERIYSKDDILALYLNTVPFGEDTYGIRTAAKLYFNKNPLDLDMEETALLVGMLKATSYYNPRKYPVRSKLRRNVVLSQMEHYGYLTEEQTDSLQSLPLELDYSSFPYYAGIAPYFREFLRQDMEEWCSRHVKDDGESYNLYMDGLKIYTTIDSRLQQHAEDAVAEQMKRLQSVFDSEWKNRDIWRGLQQGGDQYLRIKAGVQGKEDTVRQEMTVFSWEGDKEKRFTRMDSLRYFMHFLQTGFLAEDVKTAAIRAWVGGVDFKYFKYDHVMSKRQPGSAFKPLVYLAALQNGVKPCDFYSNDSVVYAEYDDWSPQNADNKYGGSYSVKGALTHSVNTITAALIMETGTDKVVDLAHESGIRSDLPDVPSIALGTASVSLYEMINVYRTIADGGVARDPVYLTGISDNEGNILFRDSTDAGTTRAFSQEDAEIMTAMLQNVVNQGTATALRSRYGLTMDIAGKTGTSQNHADGWFIGYTPALVAGVWVGGELPDIRFRSFRNGQGAATALPIFATFLKNVYADHNFQEMKNDTFTISDHVTRMLDCDDYREQEAFRERVIETLRKFRLFRRRDRRHRGDRNNR